MHSYESDSRGFSLVELLAVLAIAAALAGGAVLAWPRMEAALQLDASLHQLAADLHAAHTLAIASAGRVRLVLAAGEAAYVRERVDPSGIYRPDVTRAFPPGITVAAVNSGGDLTFTGRGQAENATVVLADRRGARRALTLNQRGRITILAREP